MENKKWLKRKYSNTYEELINFFDDKFLQEFRNSKYKMGKLVENVGDYSKGSLVAFKRSNPINDYNYPIHHGIVKCSKGYTTSGYHSISIFEKDFKEIKS